VIKKSGILLTIVLLGLSLGGCSKCGWIWDDWRAPGACRSDAPAR
jgi:hypothetical protein